MLKYRLHEKVAVIGLDDGKANAVGHNFVDAMTEGLDQAEREAEAVVITGREGVFSAGFDLKEMAKGEKQRTDLVNRGAAMLLRLFSLPAGCSGQRRSCNCGRRFGIACCRYALGCSRGL